MEEWRIFPNLKQGRIHEKGHPSLQDFIRNNVAKYMYLAREVEISQPGKKKNRNSQRELIMPHEKIFLF